MSGFAKTKARLRGRLVPFERAVRDIVAAASRAKGSPAAWLDGVGLEVKRAERMLKEVDGK